MQPSILKPDAPQGNDKFRVLIVEDDPPVARLLENTLKAVNLDCVHAPDGVKALELFNQLQPHLVLLDVGLPGLRGDQVCAKIREASSVPIIMLTAMSSDEQQVQGFKVGADDYVAKPFSPKLLVARVVANLRRAYRYDACPDSTDNSDGSTNGCSSTQAQEPSNTTPPGWANCDRCGYMGPRQRFEHEDAMGRRTLLCPVCKDKDHIIFSIS
ncbi:MAG TPA: response regulator transcription factor [Abditibacteriaceae bacterium]|jgi:DNA-binding response OmpR family regulator